MATVTKQAFMEVTPQAGSPTRLVFPEAASQTFKKGACVYLTGGALTECGADPATILGIALDPATGVTGRPIRVTLLSNAIFEASLSGTSVTAATDVGVAYGVVLASGLWLVDKTDTTAKRVTVMALSTKDNVGDTNGRVLVLFAALANQAINTALT